MTRITTVMGACGVLLTALATPAAAQQHPTTPGKSGTTALHLSLWGTVIPVAGGIALAGTDATDPDGVPALLLITGGLAIGPSLGHFYAGDTQRAWAHAALRSATMAGTLGVLLALCDSCLEESEPASLVTVAAGSLAVAALAGWDIATAPAAARESRSRLSVAPWIGSGSRGSGLVATWRFRGALPR